MLIFNKTGRGGPFKPCFGLSGAVPTRDIPSARSAWSVLMLAKLDFHRCCARLMNFRPHELFKVTEEDRRDVEVKLT